MKTYQEWRDLGYCVKKGQKSAKRNVQGVAVFSLDQVGKIPSFATPQGCSISAYSPWASGDLDLHIQRQMVQFGVIPSDMDLWLEENEIVSRYPDAPEFEDHWMNIRDY